MSTRKPRTEWKLAELAEEAGVSPRTVRYYVQRGLLSAPAFRGPDTVYGEEHLVRLRAIRVMQARFLPLDAIQVELQRLTPEELRKLSNEDATPRPPPVSQPSGVTRPSPEPLPTGVPRPPEKVTRYERWEVVPGLELHVSETADAKVRALAERMRVLALIEDFNERTKS